MIWPSCVLTLSNMCVVIIIIIILIIDAITLYASSSAVIYIHGHNAK